MNLKLYVKSKQMVTFLHLGYDKSPFLLNEQDEASATSREF
jgi:hypothetical protein